MASLQSKYGDWACVVGAAEGLGAAFARGLAKRGFNLILNDIDALKLKNTTSEVVKTYNIEVAEFSGDIGKPDRVDELFQLIKSHNCRFFIYNAAYGPVKPFLSNSEAELDRYINLNITSTLHLVYRFIDQNQDFDSGIMLLSSLAGFRGTRFVIPYAATKAFLWNLAEGLHYEFKDQKLDVSVCCPGMTDTPNFQSTNPKFPKFAPKPMNSDRVAEEALNYFGKRLFIIPGFSNKFSHFVLSRLLPRKWASSFMNSTMYKMYS